MMFKIKGRSLESIIAELIIRISGEKSKYIHEDKINRFIEKRRIINEKTYTIPFYPFYKSLICKDKKYDMDVFYINKKENQKQILYLHGGGYINQPFVQHIRFLTILAKQTNTTIILPIYPKAPVHTYNETFEKLLKLYEGLLDSVSSKDIILMGDSAGGGLSLAFAKLLLKHKISQPKEIILISPWLDITMSNPNISLFEKKDPMLAVPGLIKIGKLWAGDLDSSNYLVSPINGEIVGLGNISIFIGTNEILLPDARKFRDIAYSKGIKINYYEYEKMNHVFPIAPIPEAKKAIKQIEKIIN